jgi:hypothetical protein
VLIKVVDDQDINVSYQAVIALAESPEKEVSMVPISNCFLKIPYDIRICGKRGGLRPTISLLE